MAIDIPFKLLEINVFSAQDLPPVSKMLRTFAVAWISPDHKLSTRIDHHGHTNPTWNYKLVFRVEDRFLQSESAAVTIEIYNVAWLRDLPIGTVHLMINQISPPLIHNSPSMRTVALHIRRPSGHLQGILNVGVNILDNGGGGGSPGRRIPPVPSELTASEVGNNEELNDNQKDSEKQSSIDEKMMVLEEEFNRAKAQGSTLDSIKFDEKISSNQQVIRSSNAISSIGSMASAMNPLPSEVVTNLKKGFYSSNGNDYGSSIFDNWTEAPEDSHSQHRNGLRSRSIRWSFDDKTPLSKDHEIKSDRPRRKRNSEGGLFSCFGKGFEFTLICGSSNMKKNRKHVHNHRPQKYHFPYPDDDLRRFYP